MTTFTTRDLPWMKIGTIIDDPSVDATEAARLGGLDFDVELCNAGFSINGDNWYDAPNRRAVVRKGTGEWYSFVSTDYRVVQYREAFKFMDNINPNYVAAGTMSNGRQGFMIVQLPDHLDTRVVVNGVEDPHRMYVVLQTSHDLSKGVSVAVMMLRDKCMNQLTLPSFTANARQRWSFRHVGDPHEQLKLAHETLSQAAQYQEIFTRTATQLGSVRVTTEDLTQILTRVLPDRPKRPDQITGIVDAFTSADTVGFNETGWGAVNAVSDYFQWRRNTATRTAQSEFTSALEGDTAKYVNRTAQLLMRRA